MMGRNRRPSPAAWAIALVLGLPALAEAQLLPRLPTWKRQRPPCEAEPPIYKMYRQQYFGYYPTCWRRFPPGWGCLDNPERPNFAADLVRQPLPAKPERGLGGPDDILDGGRVPPAGLGPDEGMPELPPPGTSPFDMPEPKPPGEAAPLPGAVRPPAELPPPAREDRGLPPTTDRAAPAAPPADAPAGARVEVESPPPPIESNGSAPAVEPLPPPAVGPGASIQPPAPVRAPQRRSMLASLIDRVQGNR